MYTHSSNPVHLKDCEKCRRIELENLKKYKQKLIDDLKFEKDSEKKYLEYMKNYKSPDPDDIPDVQNEILQIQLQKLKQENSELNEMINTINNLFDTANQTNESIHQIRNEFHLKQMRLFEESSSNKAKLRWINYSTKVLLKTSVWNDLFYIKIDKNYASINGLKISILNSLDKRQLNKAFGDCVLLMYCVERYFNFKYFKPKPFGRHSYFSNTTSKQVYPLHFSDDRNWKTSLNNGIKALLVCMKDLETKMKNLKVPGKIDLKRNKISGYPFGFPKNPKKDSKLFNNAWRYILSNLKVYLVYISKSI
jgi:hypothetical protein